MNIAIEEVRQSISSLVGKEMFIELCSADWNAPSTGAIDALGVAFGTHPGSQRPRNEDRAVVAQVTALSGERFAVVLVCDGVGGLESGDMAATVAVATCIGELAYTQHEGQLDHLLQQVVRDMDEAVRRALKGRGATTASILLVSSKRGLAATNVGDSRLFSWAPDEHTFRQVSVDDTLENELRNIPGRDISALNARGLRGSLSQALGEAGRTSSELRLVPLYEGSFRRGVVLASDGAWKSTGEGFSTIAEHAPTAIDLVRRTIAAAQWGGGVDNVSIIAIKDLTQLLSDVYFSPSTFPAQRRVVAWFAGVKIIIRDFEDKPTKNKTPRSTNASAPPEEATTPKKRKPAARIAKKRAREPDRETGQQFELGVDQEEQGQQRGKPKIVISTDDTPPEDH